MKNLARETIDTYEEGWNTFTGFLSKKFEEVEYTHELERIMPIEFVLHMREKNPNISDATINIRLRAVRAILYYFMDNGLTEIFQVKQVKERLKEKEGLNVETTFSQNEIKEAVKELMNLEDEQEASREIIEKFIERIVLDDRKIDIKYKFKKIIRV